MWSIGIQLFAGEYRVPYGGLYQITITHQAYEDYKIYFHILIDGAQVAFTQQDDFSRGSNSISMTKNFHLVAGQVVKSDYAGMDSIYVSSDGILGFESWFSVHLIVPDDNDISDIGV